MCSYILLFFSFMFLLCLFSYLFVHICFLEGGQSPSDQELWLQALGTMEGTMISVQGDVMIFCWATMVVYNAK